MKKILALLVLSIAMVSCYEEYLLDYPTTSIYFPNQQDVRTFVVGEGMKFKVGAALGGVRHNDQDRNVTFTLDPTLITANRLLLMQFSSMNYIKNATLGVTALQQLPSNYYTMTPSTTNMLIPSGWHEGSVTIKADSLNFCNDSLKTARLSTYVLPFYIQSADADSILEPKRFNVVGTMLENLLFGNYWHGGAALVNRASNPNTFQRADTTIVYKTTVPCNENLIWTLTTQGPSTLFCNGYANNTVLAGKKMMKLTVKGNKVTITSGSDAPYVITAEGECSYNNSLLLQGRKIFLKYTFTQTVSPWFTYHCTDTLTFRNRIRDGINEWQDENPSHYTK